LCINLGTNTQQEEEGCNGEFENVWDTLGWMDVKFCAAIGTWKGKDHPSEKQKEKINKPA
jgi:hypothetical protein